jgi:hypothetical protein
LHEALVALRQLALEGIELLGHLVQFFPGYVSRLGDLVGRVVSLAYDSPNLDSSAFQSSFFGHLVSSWQIIEISFICGQHLGLRLRYAEPAVETSRP